MRQLTDQEQSRRDKLQRLYAAGIDPYPARIGACDRSVDVRKNFDTLERKGAAVTLAGRVRAIRLQGGALFIDVDDGTDENISKFQCFLSSDTFGVAYRQIVDALDLGDFVRIQGTPFTTRRGEPTLKATAAAIIAKAVRPLPSSWHGLEDVELRYRHRELELVTDPGSRTLFARRAKIVSAIRAVLTKHDFLEVETPILQPIAGGATARPFVTHHNALNFDLYLRIAPELYLKRLIVGGFNRVFEIGRCFRNEGIDRDHNPEFTQVELYAAYWDYEEMMRFAEKLVRAAAKEINPDLTFVHQGAKISIKKKFARVSYRAIIKENTDIDIDDQAAAERFGKSKLNDQLPPQAGYPKIVDEMFKTFVRPKLIEPTFVYDYPIELSPLAKRKPDNPKYTERFQLLMGGTELGNAFSELNDPVDQRKRFETQEALRAKGDEEAQRIDEDFLQALEYGMPPTAGLGLGIDRLTAVLTGMHSVKNVVLFPTMKPKP